MRLDLSPEARTLPASRSVPRTLLAAVEAQTVTRFCAAALAVALACAAASYESDLNVQRPPVLAVRAPRASVGRGPAKRVVWLMVDGLRLDASRGMPVLNRLRADGEDVSARSEFPTFSGPNFVAQASGIEPAASGVLTNGYPGEVALDSVFRRAKLAGLRTGVLTTDPDPGLSWTYGSWVDDTITDDPHLHLPPADLLFVHVGFVDHAAHRFGAASPEYRAAVARADAVIARVAQTIDPARETLVITSDHGNLDAGGHGGTEPEVMRIPVVVWGAGTVRGTRAGRSRDVAPTIATLLGIGPLAHATGRPLLHADAATSRQRDTARAAVSAAGALQVDRVPAVIPIAVVVLLVLARISGVDRPPLMTAATYTLVFAGCLLLTDTLSFSVGNEPGHFGARLLVLGIVSAIAQLGVGGRRSLVPAALTAAGAVLCTAIAAAHQPIAPANGTLRFLPIPALAGLAFICFTIAAAGWQSTVRSRSAASRRRAARPRFATVLPVEPALATIGEPVSARQAYPD